MNRKDITNAIILGLIVGAASTAGLLLSIAAFLGCLGVAI